MVNLEERHLIRIWVFLCWLQLFIFNMSWAQGALVYLQIKNVKEKRKSKNEGAFTMLESPFLSCFKCTCVLKLVSFYNCIGWGEEISSLVLEVSYPDLWTTQSSKFWIIILFDTMYKPFKAIFNKVWMNLKCICLHH